MMADELLDAGRALLLVIAANATPWLVGRMMGRQWTAPLDFGLVLRDGQRLFGDHKTWRGVASGALACGLVSHLLHLGFGLGVMFGLLALVGDAASSACKRRLHLAPGAESPALDQLPEALLPLIVFAAPLRLDAVMITLVAACFAVFDLLAARIRRDRR